MADSSYVIVDLASQSYKTIKLHDNGDGTFSELAPQGGAPAAPLAYRTAVNAADVMAAVGTVTCTNPNNGIGALTAGTYTIFVVARNAYGRGLAKQGNATVVTSGANLTARAAFATVTGATNYDIYCSTGGAAALFVGSVTEAQRLSGIIINAQDGTTAGGTGNAVDIAFPGTGQAVNGGELIQSTAYVIPASPVASGTYQYVDFDLTFNYASDTVLPALTVMPMFLNSRTSAYFAGSPINLPVYGTFGSFRQRLRIETRGASVALLVVSLAGTNATVDMDYSLN